MDWTEKGIAATGFAVGQFRLLCIDFEGIRSDQIVDCLNQRLLPNYVSRNACFLWRFFDRTYSRNYDLRRSEDVKCIRRSVIMDDEHQRAGGGPTNLNAVYRKQP